MAPLNELNTNKYSDRIGWRKRKFPLDDEKYRELVDDVPVDREFILENRDYDDDAFLERCLGLDEENGLIDTIGINDGHGNDDDEFGRKSTSYDEEECFEWNKENRDTDDDERPQLNPEEKELLEYISDLVIDKTAATNDINEIPIKMSSLDCSRSNEQRDDVESASSLSNNDDEAFLECCIHLLKKDNDDCNYSAATCFSKHIIAFLRYQHDLEKQRILLESAARLVQQQERFRQKGKPTKVTIGYSCISPSMVPKLQQLSSTPRIRATCYAGVQGVPVTSDPSNLSRGGVGVLLAMTQGIKPHLTQPTRNINQDVDTVVINDKVSVLRDPAQCIPLLYFDPISAGGSGRSDFIQLHETIQSAADEYLNDCTNNNPSECVAIDDYPHPRRDSSRPLFYTIESSNLWF